MVYIPTGSLLKIIPQLQREGLDISRVDGLILPFIGYLQAGWIDLKKERMNKWEFLYRLTTSKAALVDVMIKPGETNYFIFREIGKKIGVKNLHCPNIDEGFLKPDTYRLPIGMNQAQLCRYLYDLSEHWHKEIARKLFGDYNYNVYQKYLIVASIIQKEATDQREFKKVAAVIYNRLKRGMALQMDGTLNYGKYSHIPVTPTRIRKDKTPYNTYRYKGLPPTPICVVQRDAIIAAVFPATVPYLYFTKCGKYHIFTTNYQNHLKYINYCKRFNQKVNK